MEYDTVIGGSKSSQIGQAGSLHEAAWPDMLTDLYVAYAELTRTQLDLEYRMREIDEARQLFERVVESMAEALFLMDTTGRIVKANRAAGELLERDLTTVIGETFTTICASTAIPATPWQLLEQTPSGVLSNREIDLTTQTGRLVPVSLSCGLVRDQRGKITGVLIIARDITASKQAEAERQALQQQLIAASRRAGMADVAANVLHNVGNILNSINVTTSLVARTVRNAPIGDINSTLR